MLKTLQGHENIVNVRGFSGMDCVILMDFICFSFSKVGIEQENVSNLKAFVRMCDIISDFQGFEHMQFHTAIDVCTGLECLHHKNIVHRDLKSDNILISNQHYINCEESEIHAWWTTRPVIAILTDFGESRSNFLQTKTVANTVTQQLVRGSPAYMAPEALIDDGRTAYIEQLKAMDVWSLGMVMFSLINPDAQYPYGLEMEAVGIGENKLQALKKFHALKQLPQHLSKYAIQQCGVWKRLHNVFLNCVDFMTKINDRKCTLLVVSS
jgi:serine/threonine protein kinase